MKLNKTNKKIASLFFSILMITTVFVGFVTPVMADEPAEQSSDSELLVELTEEQRIMEKQLRRVEDLKIQAQLKELERLREEFGNLTDKEIQGHREELEILSEEVNPFLTNRVNEVITIPDPNFEIVISETIGKPTGN